MPSPSTSSAPTWLLRLPEVFGPWRDEILAGLGVEVIRSLGKDYLLARADGDVASSAMVRFLGWKMPLDHGWPCNPRKLDGFIEKAAQGLAGKFGDAGIQAVLVGSLDPGGDRYFRSLASNLRGRVLQLFGEGVRAISAAEQQDPDKPSLFVFVGKEGLFAGVSKPRDAGGFHPGGTRFIRQSGPDAISRAGAKVVESLHHLQLYRQRPLEGGHWLEFGASPGGMTSELLARGFKVTAVDRAPLDARLDGKPGLRVVVGDAGDFNPPSGVAYDAILSDMNGDALLAFSHVLRMVPCLKPGGLVVFTLKLAGVDGADAVDAVVLEINRLAERVGLEPLSCRHLTYNRMEFTCLFVRNASSRPV